MKAIAYLIIICHVLIAASGYTIDNGYTNIELIHMARYTEQSDLVTSSQEERGHGILQSIKEYLCTNNARVNMLYTSLCIGGASSVAAMGAGVSCTNIPLFLSGVVGFSAAVTSATLSGTLYQHD